MTTLPSLIIFVNTELFSDGYYSTQQNLVNQLYITEVLDGYEYDQRITADPNYPTVVHLTGKRLLILRDFSDLTNRETADIVMFVKHGLAAVETSKVGPPGVTYPVKNLNLYHLIYL
jgi:hypothetical protein